MIYLDQAATSFPKPAAVLAAVRHWMADLGVSSNRGDSARCAEVGRVVEDTRRRLAALCGVIGERVAFTSGATESLNLLLRGILRPGDRVLTTALEHSSLVRPLLALRDDLGLDIVVVPTDARGVVATAQIETALRQRAFRLLAFSHASNVVGTVLDAAVLCATARQHHCMTLLDASQTAGMLALDVGADAVIASAHKSLLGPPGLGFMAVRPGIEVRSGKQGGTGSSRALDQHPTTWPDAMQAGTPNTAAIFGLHAALDWLAEHGSPLAGSLAKLDVLRAALTARPDIHVFGDTPGSGPRIPVLSFTIDGLDPAEVGALLAEAGIHVRSGHHCAPWIHDHLGTTTGGTVRVSPGPFNTADELLAVAGALG